MAGSLNRASRRQAESAIKISWDAAIYGIELARSCINGQNPAKLKEEWKENFLYYAACRKPASNITIDIICTQ